ncbi:zinc dependent phospholipase C family protein [Pedobacter frigoris]|uniref:S1/P1 Nuclease n=1 Tax=Pedobacter frigoris TaxID=2571272 RepID=A0A4U1CLQ2_9SPHI|nr:zinc dependent phospholipase C family protein [Pedobacter frigoris]TKC08747.1 S1/P1 Nuclease [Pedobacter frigoris]
MKHLVLSAFSILALTLLVSWGFFAHMKINRFAVFTLPNGINRFYKANIKYLSEHAVDPDKRRYADTAEAPRHYLDVELYEKNIDSIPRKWEDAVKRYGLTMLNNNGILPWQIQVSYYKLVNAFKSKDSIKILVYSAYLGHYIADAHVPLHTTKNHNGQLTGQTGIHAFWESRLPELFHGNYNYMVGKARYIESPLKEAWKIITHTHSLVDSVLQCEATLNNNFPTYRKYSFSERNAAVTKQYSREYAATYQQLLNNMVEHQMKASILAIGSFWYSAWVDAGQPDLRHFKKNISEPEDKKTEQLYQKGTIIGREN